MSPFLLFKRCTLPFNVNRQIAAVVPGSIPSMKYFGRKSVGIDFGSKGRNSVLFESPCVEDLSLHVCAGACRAGGEAPARRPGRRRPGNPHGAGPGRFAGGYGRVGEQRHEQRLVPGHRDLQRR